MDLDLRGKNVLITGGSKGIGLACAKLFQAEGAHIGITSRSVENIAQAEKVLGQVTAIAADLRNPDDAAAMVATMERDLGPIDIVINSAGAAQRTAFDQLTPAAWHAAMDAKFFTTIHVADPLIKLMAARGHGVIVNIIGNGGKVASPVHIAGGAANAALMLATVGLANAYAGKGLRVVGLNPGLTNTQRVQEGLVAETKMHGISMEEALKRAIARIPLGRMAEPEEIAQVAAFLASKQASYITGVTVSMDGASAPVVL